jgi:hypothetical protein
MMTDQVGKSGSEIYEMLKEGFGEEAMTRAWVFFWTKEFLNGWESVEGELRSGRPVKVRTDENIKRIEELVRSDRRFGVRDISARLNIARETVRKILVENLGMTKVCAKMVPKNLTIEQMLRSTSTLLTGSCPQQLLSVPPNQEHTQRGAF